MGEFTLGHLQAGTRHDGVGSECASSPLLMVRLEFVRNRVLVPSDNQCNGKAPRGTCPLARNQPQQSRILVSNERTISRVVNAATHAATSESHGSGIKFYSVYLGGIEVQKIVMMFYSPLGVCGLRFPHNQSPIPESLLTVIGDWCGDGRALLHWAVGVALSRTRILSCFNVECAGSKGYSSILSRSVRRASVMELGCDTLVITELVMQGYML